MLGYITVGTNNLARAGAFYDALLALTGASRSMQSDRFIAWNTKADQASFGVILPFDGKPATVGNGTMHAFSLPDRGSVDAFYQLAIELGAQDEGGPGPRGDSGFYAAYFRDLDGNKLNAFCIG